MNKSISLPKNSGIRNTVKLVKTDPVCKGMFSLTSSRRLARIRANLREVQVIIECEPSKLVWKLLYLMSYFQQLNKAKITV